MKTSTRIFLSLFLSFLWLCPTGAQAAESTTEVSGLKYVLVTDEDGKNNIATIVGYSGGLPKTLTIDATVDGDEVEYSVVAIGEGAFSGTALTSVTFGAESKVTSIGANAFKDCEKLTSVTFPTSLESIGAGAFAGAGASEGAGLTDVTFPASLVEIGAGAFAGAGLTSATLKAEKNENTTALVSVGKDAFKGTGLTSVTFENATSLETIGEGAFEGCGSLSSVVLTGATKLATIGANAFYGIALQTVDLSWFTGLKTIGEGAFAGSQVEKLWLPENLETIDEGAFKDCDKLIEAEFRKENAGGTGNGSSLDSIGKDAFKGCTSLVSVTLTGATSLTKIGDGAFEGCEALASVELIGADNLASIGANAFKGIALETVDLSWFTELTEIGAGAFAESKAKKLWLPKSLVTVGEGAFAGCTALTEALVKESGAGGGMETGGDASDLASIGKDAFKGCTSLETVVLRNAISLTEVGESAFNGCTELKTIWISEAVALTEIGDSAFAGIAMEKLDLTAGTAAGAGAGAVNLTKIGEGAFAESKLTSVVLPEKLAEIGAGAFAECSTLTSVTLTSPVPPKVGAGAFEGIDEDAAFKVDGEAFLGAYQEDEAWAGNFPAVYVDAAGFKFYIVEGTAIITGYKGVIEDDLSLIIPDKFTVTIPEEEDKEVTVIEIGNGAFKGLTSLTAVAFSASVTAIGESAFAGLTGLTEVTFAEVTAEEGLTIGAKAFARTGLIEVAFPASVTAIGDSAFKGSKDLKEVAVPAVIDGATIPPATLGEGVFEGIDPGRVFIIIGDDEDVLTASFAAYSGDENGWSEFFKDNTNGDAYGFKFTTDEEGATVTTITEVTKTGGELTIPERVTDQGKAYDVVAIKEDAFKDVEDKLTVTFLSATPPDIDPEDGEVEAAKNENIKFIPPAEALFAYQTSAWWPYVELPVYAFTFTTAEEVEVEVPAEEGKGEEEKDEEGTGNGNSNEGEEGTETIKTQTKIVRTATVTGVNYTYTGQEQVGKVTAITIPKVVIVEGKAYTITAIADEVFAGCINLTKFHLESATPPVLGTDVFKGVDTDKVTFSAGSTAYTDDAAVRAFYEGDAQWKRYFPKKENSKPEEGDSGGSDSGNSGGSDGGNGGGTGGGGSTSGSFRVTFHTGTGTSQTTIAKGDTIPADIVPVLEEREGYTLFWYAGSDASNIWDFSTPVTAVLDLYPVWVAEEDEDDGNETGIGAVIGGGNGAVALYNLRGQLLRRTVLTVPAGAGTSALRDSLGVPSGVYILTTPEGSRKIKL